MECIALGVATQNKNKTSGSAHFHSDIFTEGTSTSYLGSSRLEVQLSSTSFLGQLH